MHPDLNGSFESKTYGEKNRLNYLLTIFNNREADDSWKPSPNLHLDCRLQGDLTMKHEPERRLEQNVKICDLMRYWCNVAFGMPSRFLTVFNFD